MSNGAFPDTEHTKTKSKIPLSTKNKMKQKQILEGVNGSTQLSVNY